MITHQLYHVIDWRRFDLCNCYSFSCSLLLLGLVIHCEIQMENIQRTSHKMNLLFNLYISQKVLHLKYILQIFETISRRKVNWLKSSLVGIGVDEGILNRFAQMLGCRVDQWPLKYLGLPLGGSFNSCVFWDPMVERVQKKLSCWKSSYISLGGQIILIKAALVNVSVYYMSLYKMPAKVVQVLEKCQREFLWEGGVGKKDHLVNWEEVCRSKSHGGFGDQQVKGEKHCLLVEVVMKIFY